MDEPSFMYRGQHRRFRHNPDHPPQWAVEKYGFETAQNVMLDHIYLDRKANNRSRVTTSYGEWKPPKIKAGAGVPYNPTGLEKLIYKPTPITIPKIPKWMIIWGIFGLLVWLTVDVYAPPRQMAIWSAFAYIWLLGCFVPLIKMVLAMPSTPRTEPEVKVDQEPRDLDDDEDLETLVLVDDLEEELEDDEYFEQ
jgi:hypothetical protein